MKNLISGRPLVQLIPEIASLQNALETIAAKSYSIAVTGSRQQNSEPVIYTKISDFAVTDHCGGVVELL
jgi:hypothetical protein